MDPPGPGTVLEDALSGGPSPALRRWGRSWCALWFPFLRTCYTARC